jgi:hypothetical protein
MAAVDDSAHNPLPALQWCVYVWRIVEKSRRCWAVGEQLPAAPGVL